MEQIPWYAGAIVVPPGNRPPYSGTLVACLLHWRDMPASTRVTSFIAVGEPIDGKPWLEPEEIEKVFAGPVPPELQEAY